MTATPMVIEVETRPLPDARIDWAAELINLPIATGAVTDQCVFFHGINRWKIAGTLDYWRKKLGCRWKTRQTNRGLRVWKIRLSDNESVYK